MSYDFSGGMICKYNLKPVLLEVLDEIQKRMIVEQKLYDVKYLDEMLELEFISDDKHKYSLLFVLYTVTTDQLDLFIDLMDSDLYTMDELIDMLSKYYESEDNNKSIKITSFNKNTLENVWTINSIKKYIEKIYK